MNQTERWAVVASLLDELKDRGSWCGETHLQKAVFLLQEAAGVDLGYEFVLYKHGPYGFGLHDEIGRMRARNTLGRKVQPKPYGPSLITTESGKKLANKHGELLDRVDEAINFVADEVGDQGVSALERLSTAVLISLDPDYADRDADERAEKLVELKSHVSRDEARQAVQKADAILDQADEVN